MGPQYPRTCDPASASRRPGPFHGPTATRKKFPGRQKRRSGNRKTKPRTRGEAGERAYPYRLDWSIPARAGERWAGFQVCRPVGVDPRACGAKAQFGLRKKRQSRSPHVRGKVIRKEEASQKLGKTTYAAVKEGPPAWAGDTPQDYPQALHFVNFACGRLSHQTVVFRDAAGLRPRTPEIRAILSRLDVSTFRVPTSRPAGA